MINSQAESGQKEWNKLLVTSMRAYVRDHPEQFQGGGVGGVAVEQAAADSDEEIVRDEGGCSVFLLLDERRFSLEHRICYPDVATSSSAGSGTGFGAMASSVTQWLQEDAVRGLLAIALLLSTLLHVQHYLMGAVSC
jgi:hypothetical protein